MHSLDIELFWLLNASLASPAWLLTAARLFSQQLPGTALALLLAGLLCGPQARRQVGGVLLAMALAWLVARGLRETIPSVRPFVLGLGFQGLAHGAGAGFPSLHATMASAWAAGLCGFAAPRTRLAWGVVTIPVALCIAWSRVYLGVHFPSDLLMGLAVGTLSGWLACVFSVRTGWMDNRSQNHPQAAAAISWPGRFSACWCRRAGPWARPR